MICCNILNETFAFHHKVAGDFFTHRFCWLLWGPERGTEKQYITRVHTQQMTLFRAVSTFCCPDFRTLCGPEKPLWTAWRSMAPATSTCQPSPWHPAPTHRCGPILHWQMCRPTLPCSLPTLISFSPWASSGKPMVSTPGASPQGSSLSV